MAFLIILIILDLKALKKVYNEEQEWFIKTWNYIRDWRTFISFLIAWTITNGWCYLFIFFGSVFHIKWMRITGWSYLGFLWLPTTPEKLITVPLGMAIKKALFKKH